ncbi:MAG: hypothetical protein K0R15_2609 [Clostridiales bacterium]|jgi:uncharacterized membrane protein|nr:hypothetical protein [Clostridiales bacterium]
MKKYLLLFVIGGIGYYLLEVIYRGFSHWSMGLTGGLCLMLLYLISKKLPTNSILLKAFVGCIVITTIEFIVGMLVNVVFSMEVWDYSQLPLNLYGQVCPWFTILWFTLCIPVMYFFGKMNGRHHRTA